MGKGNSFSGAMIIILLVAIAAGAYWLGSNEPETSQKTLQVTEFYNGQEGYSLSVPSGNNSTCIWNWTGGNAAVPFSETTYAKTATEKHTLAFGNAPNGDVVRISDVGYDFKVTCVDDFGNQYTGIFPQ